MKTTPLKRLGLQYADIGSIFDNPFVYEDPCLSDLFWRELEDERVTTTVIDLPEDGLPALEHFSGLTPGHQKLCAQVAAWLLATGAVASEFVNVSVNANVNEQGSGTLWSPDRVTTRSRTKYGPRMGRLRRRLCLRLRSRRFWGKAETGREYSAANKDLGYPGGIADVASADGTLFAECGYTHIGKILRGLHGGFEMVVVSYSFEPVLFRRVSAMHFETYLKKQEDDARRTVELLPIALRYEDRYKDAK